MRQTSAIKQLRITLKEIFAVARERHWKPGRRGERGGGDRDTEDSEDGAGIDWSHYAGTETGDA